MLSLQLRPVLPSNRTSLSCKWIAVFPCLLPSIYPYVPQDCLPHYVSKKISEYSEYRVLSVAIFFNTSLLLSHFVYESLRILLSLLLLPLVFSSFVGRFSKIHCGDGYHIAIQHPFSLILPIFSRPLA